MTSTECVSCWRLKTVLFHKACFFFFFLETTLTPSGHQFYLTLKSLSCCGQLCQFPVWFLGKAKRFAVARLSLESIARRRNGVSRNRYFNDQKRRQPNRNRNLIWGAQKRRPYRHKLAHSPFFWRLVRRAHGEFNQRGDSRSLPGQQQPLRGLQVDVNATAGCAATALLEQLRLSKRRRKQQAGCSLSDNEPTPTTTTTPIGVFCPPKHPANRQVRLTCMRARGGAGEGRARKRQLGAAASRGEIRFTLQAARHSAAVLYTITDYATRKSFSL